MFTHSSSPADSTNHFQRPWSMCSHGKTQNTRPFWHDQRGQIYFEHYDPYKSAASAIPRRTVAIFWPDGRKLKRCSTLSTLSIFSSSSSIRDILSVSLCIEVSSLSASLLTLSSPAFERGIDFQQHRLMNFIRYVKLIHIVPSPVVAKEGQAWPIQPLKPQSWWGSENWKLSKYPERKMIDVGLDHLKVCPDDVFRWEEAFIDCIRIQGINITRRHRGVDDDCSDESEEAKTHSHSFNVDPFNTGGPFPWWHSFSYLVLVTTLTFSSRSSNPKSWLLPLATWSAIAIATTC